LSLLGITLETALPVLKMLGFKAKLDDAGLSFAVRRGVPAHVKAKRLATHKPVVASDSPFAKLKELMPS